MTNLLVNDTSSPISCDIQLAEPARDGRSHQPCELRSAMEHRAIVIVIDQFRVPVPGSRSGVTVQLAMNEASQAVIAYVLARDEPNGHHTANLIAKAVNRVRRTEPNAVLALSADNGRAFWEAARMFPDLSRFERVRYRPAGERISRRFASTLAGLMSKRFGADLNVESSLELNMMLRAAIAKYHSGIVERPLLRRQVEQTFRRFETGSRELAGPAR